MNNVEFISILAVFSAGFLIGGAQAVYTFKQEINDLETKYNTARSIIARMIKSLRKTHSYEQIRAEFLDDLL